MLRVHIRSNIWPQPYVGALPVTIGPTIRLNEAWEVFPRNRALTWLPRVDGHPFFRAMIPAEHRHGKADDTSEWRRQWDRARHIVCFWMSECGYTSDLVVCLVNSLVHGLQTFPDLPSLFPRSSQLPNFAPYLPVFPLTAREPGSQARKHSGPLLRCIPCLR